MLYSLLRPWRHRALLLFLAGAGALPARGQQAGRLGPAHSHIEVGVHGLAAAASNQGPAIGTDYQFRSNGSSLRGGFGIFVDELLNSRHFALHAGVEVVDRGGPYTARFLLRDQSFSVPAKPDTYFTAQYDARLRYLQVPVGFKVVAGEWLPNFRLYGEAGASFAQLMGATVEGRTHSPADGRAYRTEFSGFDWGLYAGLGGELRLTPLLSAFGGLHYYKGMFNILKAPPTNSPVYNPDYNMLELDNRINNKALGIDVGVKFFPWRQRRARQATPGQSEWRDIGN